jgi:hypothetical protein
LSAMGNLNACRESTIEDFATKVRNQKVDGLGGVLDLPPNCQAHVLVVAYDYHGYGVDAQKFPRLSAVRDGARFAQMAKDCGARVQEFYDEKEIKWNAGFPTKQAILEEWSKIGKSMEKNDCFIFYFGGHGVSKPREGLDEEGSDEMMVFMEPDGTPSFLMDDEVATVLTDAFPSYGHVLFVTDCSYSGTMCDLSRPALAGRPILHLASTSEKQGQHDTGAKDPGAHGGTFSSALLDTLEGLVEVPLAGENTATLDYSVVEVYNRCFEAQSGRFENQNFSFERTSKFDADTFRWPLIPPLGWTIVDPLAKKLGQGLSMFACIG